MWRTTSSLCTYVKKKKEKKKTFLISCRAILWFYSTVIVSVSICNAHRELTERHFQPTQTCFCAVIQLHFALYKSTGRGCSGHCFIVVNTLFHFSTVSAIIPLFSAAGWWTKNSLKKSSPKTGCIFLTLPPHILIIPHLPHYLLSPDRKLAIAAHTLLRDFKCATTAEP